MTGDSRHLEWAMRAEIYPLQVLLLTVSGWVHRHQADVIAYLVEVRLRCDTRSPNTSLTTMKSARITARVGGCVFPGSPLPPVGR